MTIAFVLAGGGSLAAVQVGMMQALSERGIRPDLLVGTSAGALNAAYVAGHGTGAAALHDLAELWQGLRRRTIFPLSPVRGLLAAVGAQDSLCSPAPLARLLVTHLPYRRLERAETPVHVVTTDVLTGRAVLLSEGGAVSALLASCAIPGIYPSVRRDGRLLCDGALADEAAVFHAVALGADRIYILTAGTAVHWTGRPAIRPRPPCTRSPCCSSNARSWRPRPWPAPSTSASSPGSARSPCPRRTSATRGT